VDVIQRVARQRLGGLRNCYATLSSREQEVIVCLSLGLSTKQIAVRLGIATKTAEHHRGSVMKKMHVKSVADLVKAVVELGL